ncbi:hypothetical protein BC828DRAFT_371947 [Blastocladiella britannica]|nr:hypothetical protein BC828DRAFT_371947 [Blastocladiella britannica]
MRHLSFWPRAVSILVQVQLVFAAFDIYVDPDAASSPQQPNGSLQFPFSNLAAAWQTLPSSPVTTVNIWLAAGTHALPQQSQVFSVGHTLVHRPTVANAIVKIVPATTATIASQSAPNVLVASGSMTWSHVQFTGFVGPAAGSSSATGWSVLAADGSAALVLDSCSLPPTANASSFRIAVQSSASLAITALSATTQMLEISADDASSVAITSSSFQGTVSLSRGVIAASGTATVTITGSQFSDIGGNLLSLSTQAALTWTSSTLRRISCQTSGFAIATLNGMASATISASSLSDITTAMGSTCSGGLFGLYDQSVVIMTSTNLTDLNGRLVYAEGTSQFTVGQGCTIARLSQLEVTSGGGSTFLMSALGSAAVSVVDAAMTDTVGSWVAVNSATFNLTGVSVSNARCPVSQSYWISVSSTAALTLSRTTISASPQGMGGIAKPCILVYASNSATATVSRTTITSYPCGSGCMVMTDTSRLAASMLTITNGTAKDTSQPLLMLLSPAAHSLSQLTVTGASQASAVVSIYTSQTATLSNSLIQNGTAVGVYIAPAAALAISNSRFLGISVPGSNGAAIVNQGSATLDGCTLSGNSARFGAAISHGGSQLTVRGCVMSANEATADGGALYLASPAVISSSTFTSNKAKRGGAWFTLDAVALQHTVSRVTYTANVPTDFAGNFHSLAMDPAAAQAAADQPPILSGDTLATSLSIQALDAFNQTYTFGGLDSVLVVRAVVVSGGGSAAAAQLTGEGTKALFTGTASFNGLAAYGPSGNYTIQIGRVTAANTIDSSIQAVTVPLQIAPCTDTGYLLEPSSTWGPNFPVCQRVACTAGCVKGTCVAMGSCVCVPGYEGVACDSPASTCDTVTWELSSRAIPTASIGVRDALVAQLGVLVNVTLEPWSVRFKSFGPSQGSGNAQLKFALLSSTNGDPLQGSDLAAANSKLVAAASMLDTPSAVPAASVYGYTWPLPGGFAAALSSAAVTTVRNASIGPTLPVAIVMSALAAIGIVGLLVTVVVIFARFRNSFSVTASGPSWIVVAASAAIAAQVWVMMQTASPASPGACTGQMVAMWAAVSLVSMALFIKAVQLHMLADNPVLKTISAPVQGISSREMLLLVSLHAILNLNLAAWLFGTMSWAPRISQLAADGSPFRQCALAKGSPLAAQIVFLSVNGLMIVGSLVAVARARETVSPSKEPRMMLLSGTNGLIAAAIAAGVQSATTTLGVMAVFTIQAFVVLLAANAFALTLVAYKIPVAIRAASTSTEAQVIIKHAAATAKVGGGKRGLVAGPPPEKDELDPLVAVIERPSDGLTTAALPIRTSGILSPWRMGRVEVAIEYRYMLVVIGKEATFYCLPSQIDADQQSMILTLRFKNGKAILLQTRGSANLKEWVDLLSPGLPSSVERRRSSSRQEGGGPTGISVQQQQS